jgi:hypothetical protein
VDALPVRALRCASNQVQQRVTVVKRLDRFHQLLLALLGISILSTTSYAVDDPVADIRASLERCRTDFNARRSEHICDLFAPSLRYDFQGLPEQNYTQLCNRLHHALADTVGPSSTGSTSRKSLCRDPWR